MSASLPEEVQGASYLKVKVPDEYCNEIIISVSSNFMILILNMFFKLKSWK